MSETVFPAPKLTELPIVGDARVYPVRRVYCVGRNYAAHAVEMGHDPDAEPPFFFQKNPDNLMPKATEFPYPSETNEVHHEIELLVALGSGGTNIAVEDALQHVFGYGVALDMTRRDLQGAAKKAGRPWEVGKAFEHSAPCTALTPARAAGDMSQGKVWLNVNGERRQTGDLDQMIWKTPEIIAYLSRFFVLAAGDVILTGTPSGVGSVVRGDTLEGGVADLGTLRITVV